MNINHQHSSTNPGLRLNINKLRLRNHLFRLRLHRIEYYKEECTDVSWRFLLRPLGVAITKTTTNHHSCL